MALPTDHTSFRKEYEKLIASNRYPLLTAELAIIVEDDPVVITAAVDRAVGYYASERFDGIRDLVSEVLAHLLLNAVVSELHRA